MRPEAEGLPPLRPLYGSAPGKSVFKASLSFMAAAFSSWCLGCQEATANLHRLWVTGKT